MDARPQLSALPGADARPRSGPPVAIIDIGSNSVRLVIYEGSGRAPTPLYNEKLMCGLGRGVAKSRRLPADAVDRALEALARFRVICRTAEVGKVWVLATAAARDAENGADFLSAAELACGHPIELLTGEREAALSAAGIISGFHQPDGIVGDLGGGSLELAEVTGATAGRGATFPLGGLVLKDLSDGSTKAARAIARETLERSTHLAALEGRTFYAVGGTWRALARLQMAERDYPLRVMHGYEFDLERGGFLRQVERTSPPTLKALSAVAEARRPLLAYGAIVLDEIMRAGRPARILISALGVREGLLYDSLPQAVRDKDPLLVAADELNRLLSRSPAHGEELVRWTDAFGASLGLDETPAERRLRHASCLLADLVWRAHPDYRGEQSLALISHASFLSIDHPGRAYLALASFFRHEGLSLEEVSPRLASLVTPRLLGLAQILAAQLRVAYPISVATAGILPRTPLTVSPDGRILLTLPSEFRALASERLTHRLRSLGKLIDRDCAVVVA